MTSKLDARALQEIDANCNDCVYLSRDLGQKIMAGSPHTGTCLRFSNAIVKARVAFMPNTCQPDTQDCFQHRRH